LKLPELVPIPEGEFVMGHESRGETFRVTLDAFLIAKYPVTNEEFAEFVEKTRYATDAERNGTGGVTGVGRRPGATWRSPQGRGSAIAGKERHPVVQVSWNDAQKFCAWLSRVAAAQGEPRTYRLPTEAEWEKAARGPTNTLFGYGDTFDAAKAWVGPGRTTTCPVGNFPPNGYGLYDMGGNVSQLCQDFYDPAYYATAPRRNPKGPTRGDPTRARGADMHVERGASFATSGGGTLFRTGGSATWSEDNRGFRVAADA